MSEFAKEMTALIIGGICVACLIVGYAMMLSKAWGL